MPHGTSLYSKLKLISTHSHLPPACLEHEDTYASRGDTSILRGRGGGGGGELGPHIKFGGKIWGKIQPSSQNTRRSSVTTRRKSWEKNLNFRVKSEIQGAKFGAPTRISETKPSDLPIWKYPLWVMLKLGFH